MSHYKNIIPTAGVSCVQSFLIQVNDGEECVMYRLGSDGTPVSFATGRVRETIGDLLRERGYEIVSVYPGLLGYSLWSEAIDSLNSPRSSDHRGRSRAMVDSVRGVTKYVGHKNGKYFLTKLGEQFDRERKEQWAAR